MPEKSGNGVVPHLSCSFYVRKQELQMLLVRVQRFKDAKASNSES